MKKKVVQFIKFLFISGTGWIIDFGLYLILIEILRFKIFYSNILSSIPAISFVFFVSTKKIFNKRKNGISIKLKYIIYFIYQMILIFMISILAQMLYTLAIKNSINFNLLKLSIKLLITPITMVLNFFVIKYLAEKQ